MADISAAVYLLSGEGGISVPSARRRHGGTVPSSGHNSGDRGSRLSPNAEVMMPMALIPICHTRQILVWGVTLSAMGVTTNNLNCLWCDLHEETVDHIFIVCVKAKILWDKFGNWWRIHPMVCNSVEELWEWSTNIQGSIKQKKGFQLGMASVLKGLWEMRNEKVFNNLNSDIEVVFKGVLEISYLWISSRLRKLKGDRLTWANAFHLTEELELNNEPSSEHKQVDQRFSAIYIFHNSTSVNS
ncbi:hypothetical protein LXL04_021640 [Taraxacum kok-saghyz]